MPKSRTHTLEDQIRLRFKCPKCSQHGAVTKRVSLSGSGVHKVLDIQAENFLAVSCRRCGFTEFYDTSILEKDKVTISDVLDVVFGVMR